MRASDRSVVAVVVSVLLATFTLGSLTSDHSYLGVSWLLILILGGITIGLRRARVGTAGVLAVQLLVGFAFVLALSSGMPGQGEAWYEHFVAEWLSGVQHMQTQASPMDPNDGVKLIFVSGIGLIMIVTDFLVSGIRQAAWALVPTGSLFLVPAIGLGTETGVASFACIALGYLAIMVAEGLNTTARWTRGLSSDSAEGHGTATPVVWRAAGLIGVPALILTIILGMLLPTFSLSGLGWGNGPGGNGPLQLTDPTLDLRRNLTQPQNKKVIEYTTDKPGGLYLRMASLPQFNSSGWGNIPMQLDPGEELPQIPGLSAEPTDRRRTTIKVLDFKSEYLPLPFAPRLIDAPGNWAYDPQSLVMLSMARGDRADAVRNLTYTVDSVDIAPDVEDLAGALPGTPADSAVTAESPEDLPQDLKDESLRVTEDADSPVLKAAAIQEYLRSKKFTYSTEPRPGSGYRALENFLLVDHKGYCEQFATAMAMMARVVGIPSRVAVGFLPGEKKGNTWEVSIRDMHAWPELYFSGFGWVRFEPTPGSVTGSAPSWTTPDESDPSDDPSSDTSSQPSSSASAPIQRPSNDPNEQSTDVTVDTSFPWERTLLGSGIGLVVLLILAAPATLRRRRRSERLSPDVPVDERVEAAWQEIRDTVLDYGGSWPEGSPRTIGHEIGERLESNESGTMT
ncbi:MAG: DUF3488 and transglutaminase-like domain-containing protein, partial [Propionibacteriaceae bacterium]